MKLGEPDYIGEHADYYFTEMWVGYRSEDKPTRYCWYKLFDVEGVLCATTEYEDEPIANYDTKECLINYDGAYDPAIDVEYKHDSGVQDAFENWIIEKHLLT